MRSQGRRRRWSRHSSSPRPAAGSGTWRRTRSPGPTTSARPDDRERIGEAVRRALEEGQSYEIELRTAESRDEPRWILAHASVLTDDAGRPTRIVGLTRDITVRKRREQQAGHAAQLQQVTAGLSAAATMEEIADVVIDVGVPALNARTGVLGVVEEPGQVRFVRTTGYGGVFPELLGLDERWPITTAIREQRLVELGDVDERRRAYEVPDAIWAHSGRGNLVAVPLVTGDKAIGVLGFTRSQPSRLTSDERALVETFARQAAQALERAALLESDRVARVRAEALQRVASAVAKAASTREVADAVAREAQVVLEAAGVTIVRLRADGDEFADVLSSHGPIARHALDEPRVRITGETVTAEALRSTSPVFVASATDLQERWPGSAAMALELGVRAIACIPLRIEGRPGALSIALADSRRFGATDRSFLVLLARTCEQGFERAAAYDAERAARRRADLLHELAASLSGAVSLADVGNAFLDRAIEHLGAGSGSLMLLDPDGVTLRSAAMRGSGETRALWLSELPAEGEYVIARSFQAGAPVAARNHDELESSFAASAARFGSVAQAAYACPLSVGGTTIGAFGLVFEEERAISQEDARLLATMTDLCAQAVERARLYEHEHRVAHRLQQAMLPAAVVESRSVAIAGRYEAGEALLEVGGDWYDTLALPDGRIGLAVGDVVGQGIDAAASMARVRTALAAYAYEASTPADTMTRLRRFLEDSGGNDFATACYAILDPRTGELRYSSAGHPPLLVVTSQGDARWLEGGRTPALFGGTSEASAEATENLESGALLVLYSDGLVERRGENLDAGLDRLAAAAVAVRDLGVEDICDRLLRDLRPTSRHDDVVVLAVRAIRAASFRFEIASEPEEVGVVRRAARAWLEEQGVVGIRRDDVILALGEACANAVEHGYATSSGDVLVEMEVVGSDLELVVEDHGAWRETPHSPRDRGRGSQIMRAVATDVEVEGGANGTRVRMRFASATGTPH